jgi:nitrile hydratase accessory protein
MKPERIASSDVAEMPGPVALPRKSGDLVFHDDWERRAFALAVSLAEQGYYDWSEFQQQLIRSIAEAEKDNPQEPSRSYYESWLISLERLMADSDLLKEHQA